MYDKLWWHVNINDKPLAEKLSAELEVGKVINREKAGHVILQILAKEEVLKIIHLINGHIRTAKIEALSRVIDWFNDNSDTNINKLPLDESSIDSNAWLAGFSQNHSLFYMIPQKKNNNDLKITLKFELADNIVIKTGKESEILFYYFSLYSKISEYLETKFEVRIMHLPYVKSRFTIIAYGSNSKNKVIEYFSKFPLLGKVSLHYELWREIFLNRNKKGDFAQSFLPSLNIHKKNLFTAYDIRKNLNFYLPPSDLINRKKYHTYSKLLFKSRHYCTEIDKINYDENNIAWFLTGFADGEGSFQLSIVKNNKYNLGYSAQLYFQIHIHKKDRALLELFKLKWGVGNLKDKGPDAVCFTVTGINNIKVVIDHFDKYPLITQKWGDFELFKRAFYIIESKKHLMVEGLKKLISIRATVNKGLSDELKSVFPDILPVKRPLLKDQEIKDPYWFSGFTNAEGSFIIILSKSLTSRLGEKVVLRFSIAQHSRDEVLMKSFIEYLGCGNLNIRPGSQAVDFKITHFENLTLRFIPFFKKYPMMGIKSLDFADWCKVAEMIKNKTHLTPKGLEEIKEINKRMNLRRK